MQTPVLNRANTRTCEQGVFAYVRMFAENPAIACGSGF